jgi:hypothetical protein
MSLIQCPECKKEISNLANLCPHCGIPLITELVDSAEQSERKPRRQRQLGISVKLVIGLIGLLILTAIVKSNNKSGQFTQPAPDIDSNTVDSKPKNVDAGNTVQTEASQPPQGVPLDTPATIPPPSRGSLADQSHTSQTDAPTIEIPLEKTGGVYTIPVRINGVITLHFILDSGASEVVIPVDVVLTLVRAGTIRENDFLPGKTYSLADGSKLKSPRFVIRELELAGIKINNVPGSVAPPAGDLLLGQSLLERLDSWALDNRRHVLVLGSRVQSPAGSTPLPQCC